MTMKRLILNRIWDRFVCLVKKYMKENDLTQKQMAELIGIQRPHLNNLLNKNPKRQLSAYYVWLFLRRRIFTVTEIYDGQAETERESEFWETADEGSNFKILGKIARLRKKGIEIEKILDQLYPDV